uniref:Uncharacterized protein n=1 Tax=viral metagenome TaxID=1070528 RepID=A0A6C0J2S2_9ZZZZ
MIETRWVVAGLVFGLVVSTVMIPPTRKTPAVPDPSDPSKVYQTPTGCVKFVATEVPCSAEPDSFNLLAGK